MITKVSKTQREFQMVSSNISRTWMFFLFSHSKASDVFIAYSLHEDPNYIWYRITLILKEFCLKTTHDPTLYVKTQSAYSSLFQNLDTQREYYTFLYFMLLNNTWTDRQVLTLMKNLILLVHVMISKMLSFGICYVFCICTEPHPMFHFLDIS